MSNFKSSIEDCFKNKASHSHFAHIRRGVEKEGLRTTPQGFISQTAHPEALGSTLTHPYITTDYSEALLEFITEPSSSSADTIKRLCNLHAYTFSNISDELIWPASMPCLLQGDASIPIAVYGSSNIGTMKHVYRRGLDIRYGRIMQSIAGIHYNFSMPTEFWADYQDVCGEEGDLQAFIDRKYFRLIRNYRKHSWLLNLLFGASPVVDESFFDGRENQLEKFGDKTYGLEHATSLRMSDLGYQNSAQEVLDICFDSLETYTESLELAVQQKYPQYEKLGVKKDGEYQQLNSNILQLENEYYSDIRPKRTTQSGEKPVQALRERGVEYIEVRILDINPFLPVGIDEEQIRFLDAFLVYCLLSDSCLTTDNKREEIKENRRRVIVQGRDPHLKLIHDDIELPLHQIANQLLADISVTAELIDTAEQNGKYLHSQSVNVQQDKIADLNLTPAGKLMQLIDSGEEFVPLMVKLAQQHKEVTCAECTDNDFFRSLPEQAQESIRNQQAIEGSDTVDFDQFLHAYHERA